MKITTTVILSLLVVLCIGVRPPAPVCRTSPLPSLIPISIGETVKFDLEDIFTGFNLVFNGIQNDHISIVPKYTMNQTHFDKSLPFRSVKITNSGRFLGLITRNQFTELAIGINHPESGVTINATVDIEDMPNLHCFDVEEVYSKVGNKTYAMIDCGEFKEGALHANKFLYVDLQSNKLFLGSSESDVFVQYNHISGRKIHLVIDPFTRIQYLYRIITSGDVDSEHSEQTYVQIFLMNDHPLQVQILDVIDHTFLELHSLAILDYQIHFNNIYLLVRDRGIYQLTFSPSQRLLHSAFLQVKFNAQKFRVEQLGLNDDLHVVIANDNTIYQYEWDVTTPAVLTNKYTLIPGSQVQQLFIDADFVIVQSVALIDDEYDRRVWVFSKRATTYTHAFGSFEAPATDTSIIIYQGDGNTIHLIHEYYTYNIKINLPRLSIFPVSQRASDSEDYTITAISKVPSGQQIQCKQVLKIIYIQNTNTSILRTGFQQKTQFFVDSPDQEVIQLDYEFFGRNISYDINLDVQNSSILPKYYIEKQHKATVNFPSDIDPEKIVYFEMFPVLAATDLDAKQVYGLIQYTSVNGSETIYPIAYVRCDINLDDYDETHTLRCHTLSTANFGHKKILKTSQVYSLFDRFIAFVFEDSDKEFFVYYYSSGGLIYYCSKQFDWTFNNSLTDVEITEEKLVIATFQYGKRIEIYRLDEIRQKQQQKLEASPIFTINTRVMSFYYIKYFSPIDVKLSVYHKEVAFVKTKSGVLGLNINKQGFPQLLFNIQTLTAQFDFEVSHDTILIITKDYFELYRLTTPLRRVQPPFLLQKYTGEFTLSQYSQINSDGFYYLVENQQKTVLVIHPNMPATSILYTQIGFEKVAAMDSIRVQGRQILFVWTGKAVEAWVIAQHPKLHIFWTPNQANFTANISAYNQKSTSQNYTRAYKIIQSNQASIEATQAFNKTQFSKLGIVQVNKNQQKIDKNITLNDSDWFTGTITYFNISCQHCHRNVSNDSFNIKLQNHIASTGVKVHAGQPVYDLKPTYAGIYGQQYNAFFKTFSHNDSIEYTGKIPTGSFGQVCTKVIVPDDHTFMISFCETGTEVNAYITTLTSSKPFTIGPIQTEAKAINYAKLVGNILMIVDNDDNPFARAGGIYLYLFDYEASDPSQMLVMLDYLDYEDLQIEGFTGIPYIGSADIHRPLFSRQQYTTLITEVRTGNVFIFTFELSTNRMEAVYLAKKMLNLNTLIPDSVAHPKPLRIQSIEIIDYALKTDGKINKIEYALLLTVKNWHHIQIQFTIDEQADLYSFELIRLFERVPYPWELTNYIAVKHGHLNASYFAVSYRQILQDWQIMAVYELPRFALNKTMDTKFQDGIPVTRMLGAHLVRDSSQICFAFSLRQQHGMLFNDVGQNFLTGLQLNKQLKIKIQNLNPSVQKPQNITISAHNHYTNYTFTIPLTWQDQNFDRDTEIIWIVISVIGVLMIIGLIIVWFRQKKRQQTNAGEQGKQSLLTVKDEFKPNYINRSSVDPESERGTVDFTNKKTPFEMRKQEQIDEQNEEEDEDNEEDEVEDRVKQTEEQSYPQEPQKVEQKQNAEDTKV